MTEIQKELPEAITISKIGIVQIARANKRQDVVVEWIFWRWAILQSLQKDARLFKICVNSWVIEIAVELAMVTELLNVWKQLHKKIL